MKWNKKIPTEDGYYWTKYRKTWYHRCQGHYKIELVHVEMKSMKDAR